MSIPVIAFFNNKGGVGKTSLVYHLAWMYAEMGVSVLAADLDPQANLTMICLNEERLEALWLGDAIPGGTVYRCLKPWLHKTQDIGDTPYLEPLGSHLHLLAGDLALASFEDELARQWLISLDGQPQTFTVLSAIGRLLQQSAALAQAELVLVDLGPGLSALNRITLLTADFWIIPLAPDLFFAQSLHTLGETARVWRREWQDRRARAPQSDLALPSGVIAPLGYIIMQHAVRLDRPVKAYDRWMVRIPEVFAGEVLDEPASQFPGSIDTDPHCIGLVKHYHSLMPMAQEARKPMFKLTPGDGAIGAHTKGVREAYDNFHDLATEIQHRYQERRQR